LPHVASHRLQVPHVVTAQLMGHGCSRKVLSDKVD
jgi:hypothetical protein